MFLLLHLAVFLSAFLLFQVELVVSKALLPTFGGSYLVWSVSVMLFQGLLLLGYTYAHLALKHINGRTLRWAHLVIVLAPLLLFPLNLADLSGRIQGLPFVCAISWALLKTIGLAFFALSTLSVLLQSYLAASHLAQRDNPYLLYATSNVGSFSGLLSYPLLIERSFDLRQQLVVWQGGYLLLALLFALLTWALWRLDKKHPAYAARQATAEAAPRVPLRNGLRWLLCAAAASAMFLAVTNVITFDIAAVPLIWVLPLSLYLLSFVLTFKRRPWYPQALRDRFPLVAAVGVFLFFLLLQSYKLPVPVLLGAHLGVLLIVCVISHGELYRLKPANVRNLPAFYLTLACGGFLGSVLVSWVLPLSSDSLLEYCAGFFLLALSFVLGVRRIRLRPFSTLLACLAVPVLLGWGRLAAGAPALLTSLLAAGAGFLLALIFYGLRKRPVELALCLFLALAAATGMDNMAADERLVLKHRNFYGIYRVYDRDGIRYLMHGTTLHGMQSLDPARSREAMTYYHASGPIGRLLLSGAFHFRSVGVVGLGAGSLAVYARPGERFDFYELDPYNEIVARQYFSFLRQSKGRVGLVFGDARLSLSAPGAPTYGALVVDAFNSDSIPVHLMTVEALRLYLRHVAPEGPLVFHISNKFMDLAPVLYANAQALGLRMLLKAAGVSKAHPNSRPSVWAALCRSSGTADTLVRTLGWQDLDKQPPKPVRPWTDRFSNILSVLK